MSVSKGKQKAITDVEESDESDLEPFPQSYLDELLEKAKAAYKKPIEQEEQEEDILNLERDDFEYDSDQLDETQTLITHDSFCSEPLPPLDARKLLPTPYLANVEDRSKVPSLVMDLLLPPVASTSQTVPLPPQPLVSKDGKLLTKREISKVSLLSQ
jgi:hypothetical protein